MTMSTVEEADKAVEMFSRYVSCFVVQLLVLFWCVIWMVVYLAVWQCIYIGIFVEKI